MSRPRRVPSEEPDAVGVFAEVPGSLPIADIAGCRQHVQLTIWWDPLRQRMCLDGSWVDEFSEPGALHFHRFLAHECGPFTAGEELDGALEAVGRYTRRALRLR